MEKRDLHAMEKAMATVRRNNFDVALAGTMQRAHVMLLQLRQLARIRAEILELKQSTVAEIRSYQKPPDAVHTVMRATFLILGGHSEKELLVGIERFVSVRIDGSNVFPFSTRSVFTFLLEMYSLFPLEMYSLFRCGKPYKHSLAVPERKV